jgi:hypothetical protein
MCVQSSFYFPHLQGIVSLIRQVLYVDPRKPGQYRGKLGDAFIDLHRRWTRPLGDEIWVAAGTYPPTPMTGGHGDRFKASQLKK